MGKKRSRWWAICDLFGWHANPEPYGGDAPFQAHSDTSRFAADSVREKIGELHQRVIGYLMSIYPAGSSDEQMQTRLSMRANTQRPRRIELTEMGIVIGHGTVQGSSGRHATVWMLSPEYVRWARGPHGC